MWGHTACVLSCDFNICILNIDFSGKTFRRRKAIRLNWILFLAGGEVVLKLLGADTRGTINDTWHWMSESSREGEATSTGIIMVLHSSLYGGVSMLQKRLWGSCLWYSACQKEMEHREEEESSQDCQALGVFREKLHGFVSFSEPKIKERTESLQDTHAIPYIHKTESRVC